MKKTKIVCTIGPASASPEMLKKLAEAGMDMARLNFSHGTQEQKAEQIPMIRQISEELDKPIAILADLQGPKLRLGTIEGIREIKKGEKLEIATEPVGQQIPIQFDLTPFLKTGERVFLNDALVELIVDKVESGVFYATSQNDGEISSNKGVNVPDTNLEGRGFTDKDRDDLEFALSQQVDYVALSYVQTPQDIQMVRDIIDRKKSRTLIIAKIEMQQAMDNIEQITRLSDALMIARGDMAIETKASLVPIYQQKILRTARQQQKVAFVATQMLESMIENPRPTRAEVSDVGNAVFDQADGVMLSAESATGKYPLEAVQVLKEVIETVEKHPDYTDYIRIDWNNLEKDSLSFSAIAASAASLAHHIKAKAIVVCSASGKTAKILASFRPSAPIFGITHSDQTRNQLALVWGIQSYIVKPQDNFAHFLEDIMELLEDKKLVKKGDQVVLITGSTVGTTGSTDTIKIITM